MNNAWCRNSKPSLNLLQRTGGDHRGGRAQLGWRTFMMTCLSCLLGYIGLEIGLWCLCTALRTRMVHATIGLVIICQFTWCCAEVATLQQFCFRQIVQSALSCRSLVFFASLNCMRARGKVCCRRLPCFGLGLGGLVLMLCHGFRLNCRTPFGLLCDYEI